jgi:uncharacterized protein (DUF302 family)
MAAGAGFKQAFPRARSLRGMHNVIPADTSFNLRQTAAAVCGYTDSDAGAGADLKQVKSRAWPAAGQYTEDAMMLKHATAIALLFIGFTCGSAAAATPGITIQSVKGSFDDVKERILTAIENRGLVLNYTAHISNMLERTGKDLGRERRIYDKAEVLEFCSAAASRSTMEADPRNIAFCPYAIAVYTLPKEPGKVYVSYRKPLAMGSNQSVKALREVGKLLDGIARDALK